MRRAIVQAALPILCILGIAALPAMAADQGSTLADVQRMIQENGYHWTAGETSVSRLDLATFHGMLGYRASAADRNRHHIDFSQVPGNQVELPARWDWREHDGVTGVKDQGNCGSCWAFAAVGALEAVAFIDDHVAYDLSEQQLISCNSYGYGCGGGDFDGCFDLFHRYGAVSDSCMPYQMRDGVPCTQDRCEVLAKATDMLGVADNVLSIKNAMYVYGPVLTTMMVNDDFRYYHGGCYEHANSGNTNHAVVIVGWDDDYCGGCWIVKNSWGTGWGDQGFFNIRYDSSDLGLESDVFLHEPGQVLAINHTPPAVTTEMYGPIVVQADVHEKTGAPLDPDSVRLSYRVNGGDFTCITFHAGDKPNVWAAAIPHPTAPATIDYYIHASDVSGHYVCAPTHAPQILYTVDVARVWEDFEGGDDGWTVGDPDDDARTGIWVRVAPVGTDAQPGQNHTPYGTKCWITGQHVPGTPNGSDDVDGGKTTLRSPIYNLTGAQTAIVKYWRWYSNDKGTNAAQDWWVVQARNDGGPWVDVERTKQSSDAWVQESVDLHALFGPSVGEVQFRFIASDYPPESYVEAALDDFEIFADQPSASAARLAMAPEALTAGSPNPFRTTTALRFTLPADAPAVRLAIYGADGRLVRSLSAAALGRGDQEIVWDGRDNAGRMVAAGPYCYTVRAEGYQASGQVTRMR